MNFIHTAAKPPIMWLPKTHTKETEKLLARSKAKIQIIIEKEEERMLLEVERIEGITRASDGEPDEKENSHLPSSVAVVVKHGGYLQKIGTFISTSSKYITLEQSQKCAWQSVATTETNCFFFFRSKRS